ncbi:MAG: hypothetical protein K8T20_18120 [Planctomycetes bacterium]|nr:hypothetical protein [Planctomycetota bacterium]
MTPKAASSVLGLTGSEDAARIQSIYEAQAAALDSRISQSEGEARARYVKDREEVELARLALLGSVVRKTSAEPVVAGPAQAPTPARTGREFFYEVIFALLGGVLFAIPSAITGYFRPGHLLSPAEMALTMAWAGPLWLLLGLAGVGVVHYPCKALFGKSPGVIVMVAYVFGSWLMCRHGDPAQSTTDLFIDLSVTAFAGTALAVTVLAVALNMLGFLDSKSPAK